MFSRKTVLVLIIIVVFAVNIIFLFFSSKHPHSFQRSQRSAITCIAPFQQITSYFLHYIKGVWLNYFFLVSSAEENIYLKKALDAAIEKNNRCDELELSNARFRKLLQFKEKITTPVVAAEIIGKDPSPWFKSIMIDKGRKHGIRTALPVLSSEGIVGVITNVSNHYSKVLLITDRNSAVDALVQKKRVRGIIKGSSSGMCSFEYVLRRHDILDKDLIVSSGLDGIFPKGLRVGYISNVTKHKSGIFQEIIVTPHVDFEKLEEVLVILTPASNELTGKK